MASLCMHGSTHCTNLVASTDVQGGQVREALAEQGQAFVIQSVAQREVEGGEGRHL